MGINSQSGSGYFNTPSTKTPLFPSQSSLPNSDRTEEKWATWSQVYHYQPDNRLRSSNLQNLPRNSKDSSFYSDSNFTNQTTHSTIGTHPDYSEQNLRDYQYSRNNLENRVDRQITRHSAMCSQLGEANRFSVSTEEEVHLKFTDKIRNNFKAIEKKMDIKIEKVRAKRDLSRFFSLNGKSYVEGGGWKKGGSSVVRYYESKEYR